MLAILLFVVSFFLVSTALTVLAMVLEAGAGGAAPGGPVAITPISLLAVNLSLAAQLPIAVLVQWLLFGVRPRWMSSVEGAFRWLWFGRLARVVISVYAVCAVVWFIVVPLGAPRIDADSVALLVIVLVTTPLQAAGEEYAVRGLVQRSVSSWFRNGLVGLVVSTAFAAIFFAVAHVSPDPWQFAYYVVFGVAASIAAWGTGGLEAGILVHAVNNSFILAPIALSGGMAGLVERGSGVGGPVMLVPMAVALLMALVCVRLARRSSLVTRAALPTGAEAAGARG